MRNLIDLASVGLIGQKGASAISSYLISFDPFQRSLVVHYPLNQILAIVTLALPVKRVSSSHRIKIHCQIKHDAHLDKQRIQNTRKVRLSFMEHDTKVVLIVSQVMEL